MRQLITILRGIFISPELLIIAVGYFLACAKPEWLVSLSSRIGQQAELLKYAGLLPAGLIAYDLARAKEILFPSADKRNIFQSWPQYSEFKGTIFSAMFYALAFAVGGVAAMLFDWKAPAAYQSAVLTTALVGSLTVAASLFNAHIKIEETFRENKKESGD